MIWPEILLAVAGLFCVLRPIVFRQNRHDRERLELLRSAMRAEEKERQANEEFI